MPAGDPRIEDMAGEIFDFNGIPGKLHLIFKRGSFEVQSRFVPVPGMPDKQYVSGTDIILGDSKVVILDSGKIHILTPEQHIEIELKIDTIDAPGRPGCTQIAHHPLQWVPHMNVFFQRKPEPLEGDQGIRVDGRSACEHPEKYVIG